MKVLLVGINSKYIHTALGIRSVATFCQKKGLQNISFLEETIQTPLLAVLAEITKNNPDVIGLDLHIWNKSYVYDLMQIIKKVMPEVKLVLGGPEASFTPDAIFSECACDYIVQGEGEEIFCALLESLENNSPMPEHVSYKSSDGTLITSQPGVVEDLSVLPFPYSSVEEIVNEHRIIYYETTRGCPFSCSYCLSGISRTLRRKPLELVFRELQKFIDAKAPLVKFVDRTYNLDEEYYLPIMQFLAKSDTNGTFHFEIKGDTLSSTVIEFLKTVPKDRFQFEIGVQTTNEKTLAAINRKDDWSLLKKNVQGIIANNNIHVHLDLIAGLPYEGLESFGESFNNVYGLKPDMLQLGFLKVLKGSKMYFEADEYGIKYMDYPPYEVLQTKFLSYEDLRFLKILEDVFDHTYNSGKFTHALAFLVETIYKGNPFALYSALTKWWEEKNLYPLGHNIKEVVRLLLTFVEECHKEEVDIFREILRFDVFIYQPNFRPDFLNWHREEIKEAELNFWRNLEIVHKYLPDYDFSTWRKIRKYLPIERFQWVPKGKYGDNYYILANYTEQKAVNYMEIALEDFIDKEGSKMV